MCAGKLFHTLGATTEKARSPLFCNLALGAPDWTTSVLKQECGRVKALINTQV